MRKEDNMAKATFQKILDEGCMDINPRPHYADGTPAHTISFNHHMQSYDLSKGEFPIITLRPIAVKTAIAELLWIYQKQSSDLVLFDSLIGRLSFYDGKNWKINNWWEEWALRNADGSYALNELGHPHIGKCYGSTVKAHDLVNKVLTGLIKDPDGRRHIINMWQEDDFKEPHGLKPCAYQTNWNVRHGKDGIDYLDMCLYQRSSDYATAGCINQVQYATFLMIMCHCLRDDNGNQLYKPGKFTWFVDNIQIYDRHIDQVKEMLDRDSIDCKPYIWINPEVTDFYSLTVDDIKLMDYPRDIIKEKNPQLSFELGI